MPLALAPVGCLTNGGSGSRLDPALMGRIPAHWMAARIEVPESAATGWLDDFDDPMMAELVRASVANNYDLAATAARVRQAYSRARIARADRLPQLDTTVGANRSQSLRGAALQTVRTNIFNQGPDISWEADIWGRLANLHRSATAEFDASSADYKAARLSLAANTAKAILELVESQGQIKISEETRDSLRVNLGILDRKLEAGNADDQTALEISLSRADIARARSSIALQKRQADAARRLLETLLGDYPAGRVAALDDLPGIRRSVPAGLPSELLLRRPDLVAAERRVDAKLEVVAASRKALLPAIRLTGGAGTTSTDNFGDLFDIQNLIWNIGSNLTQPLFRGGRLRADISLSEADLDELAAAYAETALTAFREVETALAAERYYKEQQAALKEASTEALRAVALSQSQYENGLVDIITVLESERRAFDSRSSLLTIRRERLSNRIDLYLALGGDFDGTPTIAEADPDSPAATPGKPSSRNSTHRRRPY